MDTAALLKKVRKIEIKTKGLSRHIFSGEYHSAFKGRGMSFSEVRDYTYGDDVRNIDWNVTARTGHPHVKVFEEERELTVMLLIDVSGSAYFGTRKQFKNDLITELSAVIAFSALTNNDKVGAILFTDKVEKYIPPAKGKKNILRIIRELLFFEPEGTSTDLSVALDYFNNVQKKRAIVFLMSDFRTPEYEKSLVIGSKKHDIIGMLLYDIAEIEIPNVGLIKVKDNETGMIKVIDTSSRKVREGIKDAFEHHHDRFKETFRKCGLDTINIRTDQNYVKSLLKFFKSRSK
ncbi:MAG: DUF58 domain-containing protein [Saprospiraceae bacterium]|nr:DUF58 domain-containing protein [Saprospiraceae bacterium]